MTKYKQEQPPALRSDEVIIEEETGHITPNLSFEFSQYSLNGIANSPQQIAKLTSFLNSSDPGLFILLKYRDQQIGKACVFLSKTRVDDAYLGCFESSGDERIAALILQTAISWAHRQSVRTVYGPVDKNTWYSYRFRTDEESQTFAWEPTHQSQHRQAWKKFGFQVAASYQSIAYRQFLVLNMQMVSLLFWWSARSAKRQGYRLIPFHAEWSDNLAALYRIACDAFDGTFLFETISYSDFLELYAPLGERIDYRPSFFLVDAAGMELGFILSFYQDEYLVVKSLGLLRSLHGSGLGRVLVHASLSAAANDRKKAGIAALVRSGARSAVITDLIKKLGILSWVHEYELLSFTIDAQDRGIRHE